MEIKLPETTSVDLKVGDKTFVFDLVEWNDKLFEIQDRHSKSDSWEKDWIADFRLFVRQEVDLQLSPGQASMLAARIMGEAEKMLKKLDQ